MLLFRFVTVGLLLLLGAVTPGWSQATISLTTGVHGIVKDASGGVIPNASVVLVSNAAPPQEQKSDAQGAYSFAGLRAGTYHITVSLAGFDTFTGADVTLMAGQVADQDVTLVTAAAATQTLNVVESAPTVETNDPSVSDTLSAKEVSSLPLNGRNFIQEIALAPGVSNQTGQDEASVGVQGSAAYSVNGGRVEYNSFNLDGTDLLNVGFNGSINTLIVYPSLDAIGELKILTSNYGAQYGRTASGTVIVSTKSGTAQLHGDLYYFFRNESMNARNFFDETKGAPLYRRSDVGFTLGGPLVIPNVYNEKKDKTFFFISEEYRKERTPTEFNQGVPSVAERSGNFSDVCPGKGTASFYQQAPLGLDVQAYPDCPAITSLGHGLVVPFPNNNIFSGPNIYPSRNAQAILSAGVIPLPNSRTGCNSSINSCFVDSVSEPVSWRQEFGRIDHYFNDTTRATFRYIHDAWSTITATPQYGIVTNNFPTVQNNFSGPGTSMIGRISQTLSPTLLNEAYLSYANSTVWLTDRTGADGSSFLTPSAALQPCSISLTNTRGDCPIGSIFPNSGGGKLPGLQFVGTTEYAGGFAVDPSYMPWYHKNPVYTFGDTVSKQWRQHSFQFGAEFLLYYRDQTNSVSGAATGDTQGIFTYDSNPQSLLGVNPFAAFLAQASTNQIAIPSQGIVAKQYLNGPTATTFQQDSTQLLYHQRYQIGEPFIQDDWRVSHRLTINLGVRLSLFGRYHEANDNVYNWEASAFNPALASQIVVNNGNLYYKGSFSGLPSNTTPVFYNPADPAAQLVNGLVRCGYNSVPVSCQSSQLINPAPRVGFAWDPFGDGKTSVRGGYGMFFEHGTGNETNTGSLEGSAPLVLSATVNAPSLSCVGYSVNCNGSSLAPPSGQIAAVPLDLTGIQTKTEWPYVQQWSFSIQRQLPQHIIATFAYVGSKGTHLTAEEQINSLPAVPVSENPFSPGEPFYVRGAALGITDCTAINGNSAFTLLNGKTVNPGTAAYQNLSLGCAYNFGTTNASVPNINAYRPYLGIGAIVSLNNIANSHYNSFQTTMRRTQGPLTLGLSYTYSHSLDDSSDRFDPIPDAYNLRNNYASSNFDQRHLVNISYVVDLPTPKSASGSYFWRNVLGGWQWSGITVLQSGIPFSVINDPTTGPFVADNAGVGNGLAVQTIQSYPDVIGSRGTPVPATANNGQSIGPLLYNPSIFAPPTGLTFGDAGRNFLRNPFRYNFDTSIFKNFKMGETQSLQLRGEAFNLLNDTQFEIYNPAKRNQPNNTLECYGDDNGIYTAGAATCTAGSSFLRPVDAHRARTLQLAVKFFW